MQINFKARDWHNWASAILAVPLLLVGLTAIFLAHKKELRLNDLNLTAYVAWLPGYGKKTMAEEHQDIRTSLQDREGRLWIGTQAGLYQIVGEQIEMVSEIGAEPVRDLVEAPWGLIAATKYGVWVWQGAHWQRSYKGDAWNANLHPDGAVAITVKDKGLLFSRDGTSWSAAPHIGQQMARLPAEEKPAEKITLGKLMMDLHTGKAFFGKTWEWVWIDILGVIWAFLGLTGMYLWWRTQTKRRDAARNKLPKALFHG